MRTESERGNLGETEYRINESRKRLEKLYPSNGEIVHLASGSGGDVYVSQDDEDRTAYKVRRIDTKARPDYWMKEALVMHLLSKNGIAPELRGILPDSSKGTRKVIQKQLEIDAHTLQTLKSQIDEEMLHSFRSLLETRQEGTSTDTGIIRMQYVEHDLSAYQTLKSTHPEEIHRQLAEISKLLKHYELFPSDVELVFDGSDGRLKFRDVGGFRVCHAKEDEWELTESSSGSFEERMQELIISLENRTI
jgi:hypothetical protein